MPIDSPMPSLRDRFARWISNRRGVSPLYELIVEGLVQDPELLEVLAPLSGYPFVCNRVMGAVHYLLLEGAEHTLARFYATITPDPEPPESAYPVFRAFCIEHFNAIEALARSREIQINEIRRCAALLPALSEIAARRCGASLALIDVGTCAGLNLLFDRYTYDYGDAGRLMGPTDIVVACRSTGVAALPVPSAFPNVSWRLGVDLDPVNTQDLHQVNWLIALVSPDDAGRLNLLRRAMSLAAIDAPHLIQGRAGEAIAGILAQTPPSLTPCIFHSFFIQDLDQAERAQFEAALLEASSSRDIFRISLEWDETDGRPDIDHPVPLTLTSLSAGQQRKEVLAHVDPRGECGWIEWSATR